MLPFPVPFSSLSLTANDTPEARQHALLTRVALAMVGVLVVVGLVLSLP
jgi:hypothetical protein